MITEQKTAHMGEVSSLAEVFESIEPIEPGAPITHERRPPLRTQRGTFYRPGDLDAWITDWATVRLNDAEGKTDRSLPYGARVMPTQTVFDYIRESMIMPSGDSISFEIIEWHTGRALVVAKNSLILGSRWIAFLSPEAVAEVRVAMEGI